jgi:hypothetical protein
MSMFGDWLDDQTDRDDPVGDLARDRRDDPVPPIGGYTSPSRSWMRDDAARDAYDDATEEGGWR